MIRFYYLFLPFLCATTILRKNSLVTAQSCGTTRERWSWTDHTCEEQDDFIEAVYQLKLDGTYDEFVDVHQAMNSRSHGVPEFLPWHRWFIIKFEDALREVAENPCITLPYWDWEDYTVFDEDTFGWFEGRQQVPPYWCKWDVVTGECLRRDYNQERSMWRSGQIIGMIMNYDQYRDDFSSDPRRNNGFRAALEGGPHSAPHMFVGGHMLNMLSPSDPLFFVHHGNVDRIWSIWQDYYEHDQLDVSNYETGEHYEGGLLDEPMRFAENSRFQMENGDYPTPRDVLSNNDVVNVLYKNDQLARRLWYDANPDWVEPAPARSFQVWCDRGDRSGRKLKNQDLQLRDQPKRTATRTKNLRRREVPFENNSSSSGIGLFKIAEEGGNQRFGVLSKYSTFISIEKCLDFNDFTNRDEKRLWDELCHGIPLSSTLVERMTFLAQSECEEKNNPASGSPEFIRETNMDNEVAAFECFHLPDQYY